MTMISYHDAIRRVKRHESQLRKSKFLSACLDGKVSDILQDIKTARSKNSKLSNVIDGFAGNSDIAENFKSIYSDIYNSHDDKVDLNKLIQDNNAKISQADMDIVDDITPQMVKRLIKQFHNSKNDSNFNWKSGSGLNGRSIM